MREKLTAFHNVSYSDSVIEEAVKLSIRHLHDRKLPDKAIDLLDEVGAAYRAEDTDEASYQATVEDVENVVAALANIPAKQINKNEKSALKELASDLKLAVY